MSCYDCEMKDSQIAAMEHASDKLRATVTRLEGELEQIRKLGWYSKYAALRAKVAWWEQKLRDLGLYVSSGDVIDIADEMREAGKP